MDNLPIQADMTQSRIIAGYVESWLRTAMDQARAYFEQLDESIITREVTMAARRWVTREEARYWPGMPPRVPLSLDDGALQTLLHETAHELELRGYVVTYGVGGPVPDPAKEFEVDFARGTSPGVPVQGGGGE